MNAPIQIGDRLLVIFDGHCGLCNRSVRWFLRRDRWDRLRFAPSESPQVAGILARGGFIPTDSLSRPNTILVVLDPDGPAESRLVRSDAVLVLLAVLPQPWPALATLSRLIPRFFRDTFYKLIAHWRSWIWGRLESCPLPTSEEREHFLRPE
jgi:predicted DCC family thiol-disulfide oxidoreductase YuxK